jgi:hypothetical protein
VPLVPLIAASADLASKRGYKGLLRPWHNIRAAASPPFAGTAAAHTRRPATEGTRTGTPPQRHGPPATMHRSQPCCAGAPRARRGTDRGRAIVGARPQTAAGARARRPGTFQTACTKGLGRDGRRGREPNEGSGRATAGRWRGFEHATPALDTIVSCPRRKRRGASAHATVCKPRVACLLTARTKCGPPPPLRHPQRPRGCDRRACYSPRPPPAHRPGACPSRHCASLAHRRQTQPLLRWTPGERTAWGSPPPPAGGAFPTRPRLVPALRRGRAATGRIPAPSPPPPLRAR